MRYIFSISLMCFCFIGLSQNNGYIQWNAEKAIVWEDFRGRVQAGSEHHAMTASGVSINMRQETPDSITISILANFHPDKSWLKKGKDTDHLLNHERKHFDIAEIFRRKLMKKLLTGTALKTPQINERVDKLYEANDKALLKYQQRYDDQTHHSQDIEKQKIWDAKIAKDLADLAEYDYSEVKIPISLILQRNSNNKGSKKRKRRK